MPYLAPFKLSSLAETELALLALEDHDKKRRELHAAFEAARERLRADGCSHPHDRRREYRWEHDNGYGRQSWHTGQRCELCGEEDPYNHWSRK